MKKKVCIFGAKNGARKAFAEELNAYCVTPCKKFELVNAEHLCDNKPFSLWTDYKTSLYNVCLRESSTFAV